MAKRFIDTNMFNDEWICNLSKDCKLFFIYYITTCDHAGVLRLNRKLCEFQTGLNSFDTIIGELGNSLVTIKDNVFFMPKFIKFQYPNFPNSKVKQQSGALKILQSLGVTNELLKSYLTVKEDFVNTYVNDNVYVNDNNKEHFETLKFELFNSEVWISDCERTLKTKNIKMYLTDFLNELFLKDDFYKDPKEIKSHFVNWVKIQISKKVATCSNHDTDGLL